MNRWVDTMLAEVGTEAVAHMAVERLACMLGNEELAYAIVRRHEFGLDDVLAYEREEDHAAERHEELAQQAAYEEWLDRDAEEALA